MRIIIDMQGAQGSNRTRGIGRYTLSLALAMVRNCGNHEVILALNGLFPDTIEPIRVAFDGIVPQKNIRVWEAPGPVYGLNNQNAWRRRSAELVREAFLASLRPDIVLVSSLFEGLIDDTVTSIGALSSGLPTAVILYDLIPLIHRQTYLEDANVEAWYQHKIEHLRRADLLLAISESSRQECIQYLDFPSDLAVTISTAADPQFQPQPIDANREREIQQRYGLHRHFVMYTGGIDHRKNIAALIRAYAKLPDALRLTHQLAIVCAIQPQTRAELEALAKEQGLKTGELVLTGFVPEDDLISLYNLCKAFVFPSWHEGFGLPALEAMSCGKAVIAANTSSLPEVIGRDDALFDPRSDKAITAKLAQVLTDDDFRAELEQNGLQRAKLFSWDGCAKRAIAAFEAWIINKNQRPKPVNTLTHRPKLAYISPLPPARSGISDYSAELLPELSQYYDIEVIVDQDAVSDAWINANCPIRSVAWFKNHSHQFDRVLYHFGNSSFHKHMFGLLDDVPGVVVLHDFFLSSVVADMEGTGYRPGLWGQTLYNSHGYAAIKRRFEEANSPQVVWDYPCNLSVIQRALGVVVHSDYSCRLARQWIGSDVLDNWTVVPLLRVPVAAADCRTSRQIVKIDPNDVVVCSFGMLGPTKLNHRLLDAWIASNLSRDPRNKLIFVGELPGGDYGRQLLAKIEQSALGKQIQITGWVDTDSFRHYLAAADIAVQLRTLSRGETSAAILDCMNYGLPTIVNANGSVADVPDDAVWKLADEFADAELISALETLTADAASRLQLGQRAREIVLAEHKPDYCANRYVQAIESFYNPSQTGLAGLTQALGKITPRPEDDHAWTSLAQAVAQSVSIQPARRQLFVDISELVQRDVKSGIQRVVRSILNELLMNPPDGFSVEPVYASADQGYQYARQFSLRFLGCPENSLIDEPIDFQAGDIFLGLDLNFHVVQAQRHFYRKMRNVGVQVNFVVYDLLPITLPWAFAESAFETYTQWMTVVTENDGVLCISKSVAEQVAAWLTDNRPPSQHCRFDIQWFHLGADIESSVPSAGIPQTASAIAAALTKRATFLMVGTLEPRKGHLQTLAAFERLWEANIDVNLVIVANQGWMMDKLAEKLRGHRELNNRLYWLEGISDEYLQQIYTASSCLIAASEGEGFGLPLIEAAQHQLPIIARDIPVFREVADKHAHYFSGVEPQALADAVKHWLAINADGLAPQSADMPWFTWQQSARQLIERIIQAR